MGKPSGIPALSVALIALIAALGSARVSATVDDTVRVVVFVDNRATAAPWLLDLAGKEVDRIYRHAGMKLEWLTAQKAPDSHIGAFTVRLVVRARPLWKPDASSRFLMGAAPGGARECGGIAYLFVDQALEFSKVQQTAPALVIGTVAAHEIGHLLLGDHSHSSEGMMRASWTADDWRRASSGSLLFSQRESETMRAALSACR
jgi:hypothetical protein